MILGSTVRYDVFNRCGLGVYDAEMRGGAQ